jgi:UDP-N-acetylmuramoyl-L-alanyl-D-glutamate--2,6-diaminopimelate ligase
MLLSKIFKGTDVKVNEDIDIKYITSDSRKIEKDNMFVAIKGFEQDGHKYIESAISKGATAVLVDEDRYDEFKNLDVVVLTAKNTRFILGKIANNFYDTPSKEFKLIGITGTKGKTTTSFMVKKILEESGKKVGLVGTVACYLGDKKLMDSDRTTPEALELQCMFRQMADENCEYVIMEVSSQSIKLGRIDGCKFHLGLFTNLSEDHISAHEHPSMEDYFDCKCRLFDMTNIGIVNIDDIKGKELIELKPNCKFSTYSIENDSDLKAYNINITSKLTSFNVILNGKEELVEVSIPGRFTVYNSLGAISICEKLGIESKYIISGLNKVVVPGRSEIVENDKGFTVMIDYAHSEKSLEEILKAVRLYTKGRVICVFGLGGDRDKNNRPKMGRISGTLADFTVITSDNPRYDDPEALARDIEKGIKEVTNNYIILTDRKEAVEYAVRMAKKDDIVVLCGKGHETYQVVGDKKVPFSERQIVEDTLKTM